MLKNKRGQITIFVIISILLVVGIILLFFLYNNTINTPEAQASKNPEGFISQCVGDYANEAAEKIIENGGYLNDDFFGMEFEYKKIPYLCFTPENYERCVPARAMLTDSVKNDVYDYIEPKINACFEMMKKDLKEYDISFEKDFELSVELLPRKIRVDIERKTDTEKAGEPRIFTKFTSTTHAPLYDLAVVAQKIIEQEIKYCNSDYTEIMRENKWAKIEKVQTGNDNKIYTITDTKTGEIWRFAVRNCVLDTPS